MLMVLMAWIDLGRMKMYAATRWLWLVLSGGLFVTAPVGCDTENTPQVLYGPPPDAQVDEDADVPQVLYGPPPDAVGDVAPSDLMQPLYGVFQDLTWTDTPTPTDTPQVLYGPVQVDAATDTPQDASSDAEMPQVLYGPPGA